MLLILIVSSIELAAIDQKLLIAIFIGLILFLFSAIMQHKGINNKQINLFIPYFFFVMVYIVNLIACPTMSAIKDIILYSAYGLFLLVTSSLHWGKYHIRTISFLSLTILTILLLITLFRNGNTNPNKIAIFAYVLWFFPYLNLVGYKTKRAKIKIFLLALFALSIIYLTDARSVMLAIFFMILTYVLWNIIAKNKYLFNFYFISVIALIISCTIIYPHLDTIFYNFSYYQDMVHLYTGKNLYSGRQELWGILLYYLKQRPFLGYGSGALTSQFTSTNLSAHNLYLEISFQVGIVGLFFFLAFLFQVWKMFWINRHNKKVIVCACFFIGILVHQMFEVLLIKSGVAIDILMWFLIGLGLSNCINNKSDARDNEYCGRDTGYLP